jgi:undecaprenyl phosphate N,N'-diacetylbacillosamine 1-phosphate transferase
MLPEFVGGATVKPGMTIAKRVIDIVLSVVSLILLAPVMIIIAVLIKLDSPGPVLYLAERIGWNGRPFTMYKLRSMYIDSPVLNNGDGSYRVDKGDPRVTRVGRILRVGFDELPQLFNVLRGEMSLIGPRPDPLEAYSHYGEQERRRLVVRPGITGLAQVAGRTDIPWRERIKYDIEYVEHQSLWLDGKIFLYTLIEFIPPVRKRRLQGQISFAEQVGGMSTGTQMAFKEQVR